MTSSTGARSRPCCWNQTLDIHDSELATQLAGRASAPASRDIHGDDALLAEELRAEYDARLDHELSRARSHAR